MVQLADNDGTLTFEEFVARSAPHWVSRPSIQLERQSLSGSDSCNSFGGPVDYGPGVIEPGEFASTTAGCNGPANRFSRVFGGKMEFELNDSRLRISSRRGEVELRRPLLWELRDDPDVARLAGSWNMVVLADAEGTLSAADIFAHAGHTLVPFIGIEVPESLLRAGDGCESLRAELNLSPGSIAIARRLRAGSFGADRCSPEAHRFTDAVLAATTYQVTHDHLTLNGPTAVVQLTRITTD